MRDDEQTSTPIESIEDALENMRSALRDATPEKRVEMIYMLGFCLTCGSEIDPLTWDDTIQGGCSCSNC